MTFVTQSRRIPHPIRMSEQSRFFDKTDTWDLGDTLPSALRNEMVQTTSSWRTGASAGSDPNDEDWVFKARSQAEFRKGLRSKERGESTWSSAYDRGHEFATTRHYVQVSHTDVDMIPAVGSDGDWFYQYRGHGPVFPNPSTRGYPYFVEAPEPDWKVLGTTAIKNTIPTHPAAGLATFLGELRQDGLPALKSLALRDRNASGAASDHLNYQFGVKPLVKDLRNLAGGIIHADKNFQQLLRDSGRVVRRRYYFPETSEVTNRLEYAGSLAFPSQSTMWYDCMKDRKISGTVREFTTTTRRAWFSGAYSYHMSAAEDQQSNMRSWADKARKALGTDLTPSVAWNVTPWSWLVDWNGDIGNIISNASDFGSDGLVVRYGYLMVHTTTVRSLLLTGPETISGASGPYEIRFITEQKRRYQATPFGFGLDIGTFDPRQWSILAALGMTKGSRSLR